MKEIAEVFKGKMTLATGMAANLLVLAVMTAFRALQQVTCCHSALMWELASRVFKGEDCVQPCDFQMASSDWIYEDESV